MSKADHADESAGERGVLAAPALVRDHAGIEHRTDRQPSARSSDRRIAALAPSISAASPIGSLSRQSDRLRQREHQIAVGPVSRTGHDCQHASAPGVVAHRKQMEFVAVVVVRQPGRLLECRRVELELGLGAQREILLPPRDQRLLEPGADRFARDQPQRTGLLGQRKDAFGKRCAQPLEIGRQIRLVEIMAHDPGSFDPGGRTRRFDLDGRNRTAAGKPQPAVVAPHAFLDRRLAAERRAPHARQRPRAQMRVVELPVRGLDDLAMAGALQHRIGRILRRDHVNVRMQFIRTVDRARPRHRHGVVVAGAALGGRQIVPAVAFEDMRALDKAVVAAGENILHRPDQLAGLGVIFLQQDAGERRVFRIAAGAVRDMVPKHVQEPFAAVIVMEQRRVEAARIDIDRIGPRALDRRRRDDVVVAVLEVAVEALDVGIDQPELPIRMRTGTAPRRRTNPGCRACRAARRGRAAA